MAFSEKKSRYANNIFVACIVARKNVATAKVQQQVNLQGRITFQGNNETLIAKGKTLKKQEAYLTDDTPSIRLVLWEDHIKKVTSGQSYQLMKVQVRLYNDAPYVTLNKQSTINPAQLKITRSDDQGVKSEHELKTVLLQAHGVQSITRYLFCNSCKARIEEKDKKRIRDNLFLLEEDLCNVNLCPLQFELRNTEQPFTSLGIFAYE
ncbi:hypothetical protein P5673_012570 [Acropora cervicornis]|uniref:Uncharacterized protein n=1 Tax=Acropora cervicornis TaxID=6130 RepID=A0AAD9QN46_ACRCE|nr:hypothetical protein P5673_012570 [Acropora cervicornis]